jgi:hypothetical protein
VLEGDRLVTTAYELPFKTDIEHRPLCAQTLNAEQLTKLRRAVREDYYFQARALARAPRPPPLRARWRV